VVGGDQSLTSILGWSGDKRVRYRSATATVLPEPIPGPNPLRWDTRWVTTCQNHTFTTGVRRPFVGPDDPDIVEEANEHPEVFAHKTIEQVADHFEDVIRKLNKKPVIIGHSFGGLLA
jgi:pimeloyl-ACP methyl ester carboxylesterase